MNEINMSHVFRKFEKQAPLLKVPRINQILNSRIHVTDSITDLKS